MFSLSLTCRYLGPGYWIPVALLSRGFHQEYSRQHPPHSDPTLLFRDKPMIQWFMNQFNQSICREGEGDKSEYLRIIYRGLAGAYSLSEEEQLTLLEWVKETYGFVADTSAYCVAIRHIPMLPAYSRLLTFFHEALEGAAALLDSDTIYATLFAVSVTRDTWRTLTVVFEWLNNTLDPSTHRDLSRFYSFSFSLTEFYISSLPLDIVGETRSYRAILDTALCKR